MKFEKWCVYCSQFVYTAKDTREHQGSRCQIENVEVPTIKKEETNHEIGQSK